MTSFFVLATPEYITQNQTQPKDSVTLVDMEADQIQKRQAGDSTIYLVGNVKFHHNGAIIECDSAARYSDTRMDFFGKVIINKDSAFVYGDKVSYDGTTAIAEVFAPVVKMLRGDVVLYSYNLKFNTKTNIATYYGGGIMNQKDNFMESENGEYNADLNLVKFKEKVSMRSDSYQIKTDSLNYDLDREQAEFLNKTMVWDKDSSILIADKGFYFNTTKTYEFVHNAYLLTKDQEMWADTMNYHQPLRQATMLRNVQVLDTVQNTIALSDWAFYDDSLGKAILTRLPSVITYDPKNADSSYMRADSIIMLTFEPGKAPRPYPKDSLEDEEILTDSTSQTIDSLAVNNTSSLVKDTLSVELKKPLTDTLIAQETITITDSLPQLIDTLIIKDSLVITDSLLVQDTLIIRDSLPIADSISKNIADSLITKKTPEKERILKAFHNVRSWSVDYQSIADSVVGYAIDSMASMFGRPILWSENNQISADRIDIYSHDDQVDWADFIGSPFMTQSVEPKWAEPADSLRFSQATSREMQVYFKNNELDSAVMTGNVRNYYYYMDDDGYTAAFATVDCPALVLFFKNREPSVIRWEGSTTFDIYPLEQIPSDVNERLDNFQWNPDKRPQSALEICGDRVLRTSSRSQVEATEKPQFPIEVRIENYKKMMIEQGMWSDRSEQTSVTPDYFEGQTTML